MVCGQTNSPSAEKILSKIHREQFYDVDTAAFLEIPCTPCVCVFVLRIVAIFEISMLESPKKDILHVRSWGVCSFDYPRSLRRDGDDIYCRPVGTAT